MANNTILDDEYIKDSIKKADESKKIMFDSWIVDLEKKEQPEACDTKESNCIICGS
jgi:GT2 family glycosyltransferase